MLTTHRRGTLVLATLPLALLIALTSFARAVPTAGETDAPKEGSPVVQPASDEGEQLIPRFKPPAGWKISLFAAEPRLANPVAFHIDEKGRFYVVETFRFKGGVIDLREVMNWLDDDTASKSIADRQAMVRKFKGDEGYKKMEVFSDRVRLVEDRDGDGKADFDSVFTDGDNKVEDGVAAGVLARRGTVYYTNIPNLWLLRDEDNDGKAEVKKSLSYGYGVRYAYLGHDLHGLRFGPDGKLYFSIGDRALNVEKSVDGKTVTNTDSGAVLRCNADGTELEIVHTGLRNPQELAFDEYGNLFTGDNNCDAGDAARWVHVVEGGDSGWRIGYQHHEFPVGRGPWMFEGIWKTQPPAPLAYRLPPIMDLPVAGPSGLTYTPGPGVPAAFQKSFFLCDFRGGTGSGVHQIINKPKGASFDVPEVKPFVWQILPTDVEFGYDGGMYFSDWNNGWDLPGKGRLYHVFEPEAAKDPSLAETKKLMAEGFAKTSIEELAKLLAHRDQRVRQEVQFTLADKGELASAALLGVATQANGNQLARIHAIWGLGQIARKKPELLQSALPLLDDADAEIRAQTAKVLGDAKFFAAAEALVKRLKDENLRVRFFAAQSLGKLENLETIPALFDMLKENADKDAYLRHAGVFALVKMNRLAPLQAKAKDESPAVRLASLLALRRMQSSSAALFLDDKEPTIVLEAARAINDEPLGEDALAALAKLVDRAEYKKSGPLNEMILMRALAANYRLGTPAAAAALAGYALQPDANPFYRVEALKMLGDWEKPRGRDRITGLWRPLKDRDVKIAKEAAARVVPQLLRTAPGPIQVAAANLVQKFGVDDPAVLFEMVAAKTMAPNVRVAALNALAGQNHPKLAEAVAVAMADQNQDLRRAAIALQGKLKDGMPQLEKVATSGAPHERQSALQALAHIEGPEPDRIVGAAMGELLAGKWPAEAQLDLVEAAAIRAPKAPSIAEQLKKYEASKSSDDPLSVYRETLVGGDAELGKRVFYDRADVSCLKCHSINKQGGNAGPDLAGVAARGDRAYFLESLLYPNKKIAAGFESISVRTSDNNVQTGVLKSEDDTKVTLEVPDKGAVVIEKSKIKARKGGLSAMPEGLDKALSKEDIRNLIEFLSTLK